jgi:S-adenosylmethionine hydrolase
MRNNNTFLKKQKADDRAKRRKEKFAKRLEKSKQPKQGFESMIAYVDKFGNITSEPVEEEINKNEIKKEDTI